MKRQTLPISLATLLLVFTALSAASANEPGGDEAIERDVVDLRPDDPAGFTMRNVFAPLTGLFMGGPSYWYATREIEVDTTPRHGTLDLFYIRSNFQKRFEQAESPATVILPPRIQATSRDALIIRAFAEGYRQKQVTLKMGSRQSKVVLDLDPLPNTLKAFAHRYFGGRSSLNFLLSESPTFRLQDGSDGVSLILTETAVTSEAAASIEGSASPVLAELYTQQLGEDLLVKVGFGEDSPYGKPMVRSRQSYDAARGLHQFTLDLVPSEAGESVARARGALAQLQAADVAGCALRFDESLRGGLDEGALARALTPSGSFTDPYFRAAMRRLGELSPEGVVHFASGAVFRPAVPIELEAALSQASGAIGYLALLQRFVEGLEPEEHRVETLRGLVAPEVGTEHFAQVLTTANKSRRDCVAGR
jgi:hypothetical protein